MVEHPILTGLLSRLSGKSLFSYFLCSLDTWPPSALSFAVFLPEPCALSFHPSIRFLVCTSKKNNHQDRTPNKKTKTKANKETPQKPKFGPRAARNRGNPDAQPTPSLKVTCQISKTSVSKKLPPKVAGQRHQNERFVRDLLALLPSRFAIPAPHNPPTDTPILLSVTGTFTSTKHHNLTITCARHGNSTSTPLTRAKYCPLPRKVTK